MSTIRNFTKFTVIGGVQSLIQIIILWWLIDLLHLNTSLTTFVVVVALYLLKYHIYIKINLMHPNFLKYNIANLGVAALYVASMWLLVDVLLWKALLASTLTIAVSAMLFLVRFYVMHKTGMFKH